MENIVFNPKELAEYMHISESTVRRMVRKKELPFYRVGTLIFFRKTVIDKWIEDQENGQAL